MGICQLYATSDYIHLIHYIRSVIMLFFTLKVVRYKLNTASRHYLNVSDGIPCRIVSNNIKVCERSYCLYGFVEFADSLFYSIYKYLCCSYDYMANEIVYIFSTYYNMCWVIVCMVS